MTSTVAFHSEPNPDAEIGERVHQLLWRARMPQSVAAGRLGITQSALSRKLRGDRPWFPAELIAVAAVFGTTVGALFGEVAGATPPPTEWAPRDSNPKPTDYKSAVTPRVVSLDEHRTLRKGDANRESATG